MAPSLDWKLVKRKFKCGADPKMVRTVSQRPRGRPSPSICWHPFLLATLAPPVCLDASFSLMSPVSLHTVFPWHHLLLAALSLDRSEFWHLILHTLFSWGPSVLTPLLLTESWHLTHSRRFWLLTHLSFDTLKQDALTRRNLHTQKPLHAKTIVTHR